VPKKDWNCLATWEDILSHIQTDNSVIKNYRNAAGEFSRRIEKILLFVAFHVLGLGEHRLDCASSHVLFDRTTVAHKDLTVSARSLADYCG
jgi:hypothetical protein